MCVHKYQYSCYQHCTLYLLKPSFPFTLRISKMRTFPSNFSNLLKHLDNNIYNMIHGMKTVPPGFFPVFVGEERRRYVLPISCLSSMMFKALLNQYGDENQLALHPISLSCSVQTFEAIFNLVKAEM